MNPLERVRAFIAELSAKSKALIDTAETETRDLTVEELSQIKDNNAQIAEAKEREAVLAEQETRAAQAAEASKATPAVPERKSNATHIGGEPRAYAKGNGASYFRDLALVATGVGSDNRGNTPEEANKRLALHAVQIKADVEAAERRHEERAEQGLRSVDPGAYFESRVNPNRTDGQGGNLVPPLWLVEDFIAALRAGRTTANLARQMGLPSGTDSINIPKIATGTVVAAQTADAAGVASTDFTDTFVTCGVKTLAGQQDVALQLIDQSPLSISDDVIFPDLAADYNAKLDLQVISGTGANGQVTGIDVMADVGVIDVTYTDASPTVPELYPAFGQAMSQVATTRFLSPNAVVMHPRRWYWMATALDTQNRPLVLPSNAYNPVAIGDGTKPEGLVSNLLGVDVYVDAHVPATKGVGNNQDEIFAIRREDLFLFEGQYRTRVLQEVLSGTLQVRFQLYNYFAFLPNRYPQSVARINGTGLTAPSGF